MIDPNDPNLRAILADPNWLREEMQSRFGPPPEEDFILEIPQATPDYIDLEVDLSLKARMTRWEGKHIRTRKELEGIILAVLTNDANYQGGIQPSLAYVGMTIRSATNAPAQSQIERVATPDAGHAGDAAHGGRAAGRGTPDGGDLGAEEPG